MLGDDDAEIIGSEDEGFGGYNDGAERVCFDLKCCKLAADVETMNVPAATAALNNCANGWTLTSVVAGMVEISSSSSISTLISS